MTLCIYLDQCICNEQSFPCYHVPRLSTLLLARTDAEAANLITSDADEYDKPFLTGERTDEGFFRTKNGIDQAISRGLAYAPYADLIWCETGTPDLEFARNFAEAIRAEPVSYTHLTLPTKRIV